MARDVRSEGSEKSGRSRPSNGRRPVQTPECRDAATRPPEPPDTRGRGVVTPNGFLLYL